MTRRPPFFMGPSLKRAVTIELNVIFGKWATAYRSEVVELLDPPALLDALREAFAAYSTDRSVDAMQVPVPLPAGQVPPGASGMLLVPGVSRVRRLTAVRIFDAMPEAGRRLADDPAS